jgi:dipeptidyl aminopeptidase/acylaminoacyl peptidase
MRLFRAAFWGVILLAIVGTVAYFGACVVLYDRVASVTPDCGGSYPDNLPTSFSDPRHPDFDAGPYQMPAFEDVSFPSLDPEITIAGWYVPADPAEPDASAAAPTVVLLHGRGSCKRNPQVLVPAGMLHNAGFSVLLIDLRDHGSSTVEDGRYAGGWDEHRDVIAAYRWLVEERGTPPARIGLAGMSLGAGVATIAMGAEPGFAALWTDSGFADVTRALEDELENRGLPSFLAVGGMLIAPLVSGDNLLELSPEGSLEQLAGRPMFITHGVADTTIRVDHAYLLAAAALRGGTAVSPWILADAGHVEAMFLQPDEYESRLVGFFGDALTPGAE